MCKNDYHEDDCDCEEYCDDCEELLDECSCDNCDKCTECGQNYDECYCDIELPEEQKGIAACLDLTEGEDKQTSEEFAIEVFRRNHKCPLLEAIDNSDLPDSYRKEFMDKIFMKESKSSGIGPVTYIVCEACNTKWDVTDYGEW